MIHYRGYLIDTFGERNGWCWNVHDDTGAVVAHGFGQKTQAAAFRAARHEVDFMLDGELSGMVHNEVGPETRGRLTLHSQSSKPEPAPTNGTGPELWPAVIARYHSRPAFVRAAHERHAFGVGKYGVALRAHNGRNAVIDALQEALDLVVYLEQIRCETADEWTESTATAMQVQTVDMVDKLALMAGV